MEGAAPDHLGRDAAEPPFDLIQPGTAGGGEVAVEPAALLGLEPLLDSGAFVGAVIVQDEMSKAAALSNMPLLDHESATL